MHDMFIGYHKPLKKELDWIWESGIFVFDTSVLLNIYRYTPSTREDLFKILEKIQDRIWLPHQVVSEFREQRENVILQQERIYDDIEEINKAFQENVLNRYKKGHPFADTKQIENIIKEAVDQAKKLLREEQKKMPDLLEEDPYLERLKNLFNNRVGNPYSDNELSKKHAEAQKRIEGKLPPGYKDAKNKDELNAHGDTILWFQILDYATTQKTSVIFITDDAKEDWWRIDRNKRNLGPRSELVQEFLKKSHEKYFMYLADGFIQQAQNRLGIQIGPNTIKEIREIRQEHQISPPSQYILHELAQKQDDLFLVRQEIEDIELKIARQSINIAEIDKQIKKSKDERKVKELKEAKNQIETNLSKLKLSRIEKVQHATLLRHRLDILKSQHQIKLALNDMPDP